MVELSDCDLVMIAGARVDSAVAGGLPVEVSGLICIYAPRTGLSQFASSSWGRPGGKRSQF